MAVEGDGVDQRVVDELSETWAAMCRDAGTIKFLWAHNGFNKNGWVELQGSNKARTSWCEGSWAVHADDRDIVEITFGSSKHMCHFKEGGFIVEERFNLKTNKPSYRLGAPKSCGWPSTKDPPAWLARPAKPAGVPKAKAAAKKRPSTSTSTDGMDTLPSKRLRSKTSPDPQVEAAEMPMPKGHGRKSKSVKPKILSPDGTELKKPTGGGFGVYLSQNRAVIVASLPKDHKITDVPKEAAARWKAMPEGEKETYTNQYQQKKAAYDEARKSAV